MIFQMKGSAIVCGRYLVITEDEIIEMKSILEELNQRFSDSDLQLSNDEVIESMAHSERPEIVPSLVTPVLVIEDEKCFLKPMKWGFSRWDGNGSIINARAESVEEKSFFRESFLHNRCILPSRGFFEWKKPSSAPLLDLLSPAEQNPAPGKYWIRRADSPLFFMAGIYQISKGIEEFTILTMPANINVAPIHDRMPVFLNKPQILPWLKDPRVLKLLLENQTSHLPFILSQVNSGERNLL